MIDVAERYTLAIMEGSPIWRLQSIKQDMLDVFQV